MGLACAHCANDPFFALNGKASAGTNTSSTSPNYYAWSDVAGWFDFYNTDSVNTQSTRLQGYASSTIGDLSLDCATTRNVNICETSNYGICQSLVATHNIDGTCSGVSSAQLGQLSGFAWNDTIGWISFCGGLGTSVCPGSISYDVSIDTTTGDYSGYAWNDLAGWISFNCNQAGTLCPPNYKVSASWSATSTVAYLFSSIFDTQTTPGVVLNSITWTGTNNANGTSNQTYVDFQVAVSNNPGGQWNYLGPGGDPNYYYGAPCSSGFTGGTNPTGASPNTPICINPAQVSSYRYLRYKVRLRSDLLKTDTPRVDNVILNWSS